MKRRAVYVNSVQRAITGAALLLPADVQRMRVIGTTALDQLLMGRDCAQAWRSLADIANMAEGLARIGVGSGPEGEQVIEDAQEALAYVQQERQSRGTWALHASEREEVRGRLGWLISLHVTQLQGCSRTLFERAFQDTQERIAQARAGNAPAGAIVIEGEIA
jgi:hypothetical protein